MSTKGTPTAEEHAALHAWAKAHGRTWKAALRLAWETGDYGGAEDDAALQRIRNRRGPSWLARYRLPVDPSAPTKYHVEAGEAERTKRGFRWRVLRGRYVDFHFKARGVRMFPTEAGVEEAKALVDGGHATETYRMLEDWIGNGWHFIPAEAVGALTGCTDILTQDFTLSDDSEWEPVAPRPCVFAHMNYAVELPIETWAQGEGVFFDRGEVERRRAA